MPARPPRSDRRGGALRRALLHVQRGSGLVLPLPPGRMGRRLLPRCRGRARGRRELEEGVRSDVPRAGPRPSPLSRRAQGDEGGGAGAPALPGGAAPARLVLSRGPPRDVSGRGRVAVLGLGELASTIGPVSSSQDGRTFRAPAFLRVKPNPPSAAAEYADERQLAPAVVCEVGWVNGLGAIRSLG